MAMINVDTESLVRIRSGLISLQNVSNSGFMELDKILSEQERRFRDIYNRESGRAHTLSAEIQNLERKADIDQVEYDKQQKDEERARKEGQPYCGRYVENPQQTRAKADMKRQVCKELDNALARLQATIKKFSESKEMFIIEFSKIANRSGGGAPDNMDNVLSKSITALDNYVHTNISAEGCSYYNRASAHMHIDMGPMQEDEEMSM